MKTFILAVVAFATFAQGFNLDDEWEAFRSKYRKDFLSGQEHDARKAIFSDNLNFIEKHNAEHAMGLHTYTVGINQFADMTNKELRERYLGNLAINSEEWQGTEVEVNQPVPDSIDWRERGAVTEIKAQGQCGSCWAFSATGAIEAAHFLKTGELVSLSEQNLVDCSIRNQGCDGGWAIYAFDYVLYHGGINPETVYSYEEGQGDCRFNNYEIAANLTWAKRILSESEDDVYKAVGGIGPVSVSMDGQEQSFFFYQSGIYYEPLCNPHDLNHAVLAIGYGSENDRDYWLLKNSWGETWGEKGYMKLARNSGNMCGIATNAAFPIA